MSENRLTLPEWADEVTIEDLPPKHARLAELIGIENMLKMIINFGGTYNYLPKQDALFRVARDNRILSDYKKGMTAKQLALKYDLSEIKVYHILKIPREADGQCSLFDDKNGS